MKRVRILSFAAATAAVFGLGCVVGQAVAGQPQMEAALGDLQSARAELVAADADKGGHRANAIAFVDQAITETQAGIAYAGN